MFKTRLLLVFALLILACANFAFADTEDPELKQCKYQCKVQQQFDEGQKKQCARRCDWYHQEKQRREREKGGGGEEGGGSSDRYQGGEQQEEEQGKQGQSPYVFREHHFTTKIQTQHGRVRILPKFTERSKLLGGIENFRLTILEADPQTFVVPNHWDAEAVFFVCQGKGTVSLVRQDRRESFNIRRGDILRIPSGTTIYVINRHNNKKLIVAKLLQPVSTPGQFETFFGAGGQEPESFYRAFSIEILEAALNTKRDKLQTIFGQQKQGVIIKASQEQIKALSQHEEGGIWPFGGESKGTINIFQQRPSQSNEYGQLYEVDGNKYRELQELDVAVSYANITKGGMAGPVYNSKTTKISLVVNGEGYMEMACPHLSSQYQGRQGSQGWGQRGGSQGETTGSPRYQKVSGRLRPGVVFIVPAGHPYVAVASNNLNLEVVCFEVNAFKNERFPLAGKRNVIKQLEREAKELAFGVSARVVDEVFGSQQEELFFRGPLQQQQQYEGRADA